jgi:pimeloyl-ACP methyl ester carboxylesterase
MISPFRAPMQPWPGLEKYQRRQALPRYGLNLFLYDLPGVASETMILLHGLGDEADTWHGLIEPLSQHWRVIAPDLPGFGRSDKPRRTYDVPFFCGVLLEMLKQLGIDQATWVGHSFGGFLANTLALEYPHVVSGLVLVDGGRLVQAQRLELGLLLFLVPGLGEYLYTRLRKDPQAAYATLSLYYADIEGLPEEQRRFLFQRVNERVWDDAQRRAYFSTLRNLARFTIQEQRGLAERLARMMVPTLIAWGEQDRIVPPESANSLAQAIPGSKLVLVPGGGHNLQQERPEALLDAILSEVIFSPPQGSEGKTRQAQDN